MPSKYDLTMFQGSTFELTITWKDSLNQSLVLPGCEARMQVRSKYGSPTAVVTATSQDGDIVLDANAGTISVELTPEQTETIPVDYTRQNSVPPFTKYVYDLEVIFPSGKIIKPVFGTIDVYGEVTKNV